MQTQKVKLHPGLQFTTPHAPRPALREDTVPLVRGAGVRNQLVLESMKCVEQIESLAEPGKIDEVHYGARVAASVHSAFDKVALQAARFIGCQHST